MMGSRRETADGLGAPPSGISRRTFLGWVIAAPTLVAAARFGIHEVEAAVPSEPGVSDAYDLSDMLTDAAAPTSHLITIDRKSTRLNSSHRCISYAVFCLKKKRKESHVAHKDST